MQIRSKLLVVGISFMASPALGAAKAISDLPTDILQANISNIPADQLKKEYDHLENLLLDLTKESRTRLEEILNKRADEWRIKYNSEPTSRQAISWGDQAMRNDIQLIKIQQKEAPQADPVGYRLAMIRFELDQREVRAQQSECKEERKKP